MTLSSTTTPIEQRQIQPNPSQTSRTPPMAIPSKTVHQGRTYSSGAPVHIRKPDSSGIFAPTPPDIDDLGDGSEYSLGDSRGWDDLSIMRSPEKDSEAIGAKWYTPRDSTPFVQYTPTHGRRASCDQDPPTPARTDPIEAAKNLISAHSFPDTAPINTQQRTFLPHVVSVQATPVQTPAPSQINAVYIEKKEQQAPKVQPLNLSSSMLGNVSTEPNLSPSPSMDDSDSPLKEEGLSRSLPAALPSLQQKTPAQQRKASSLDTTPKDKGKQLLSSDVLPSRSSAVNSRSASTPPSIPQTPSRSTVHDVHHGEVALAIGSPEKVSVQAPQVEMDPGFTLPGILVVESNPIKPELRNEQESSPLHKKFPQLERMGLGAGADQAMLDKLGIPPAIELTYSDLEDPKKPFPQGGSLLSQALSPSSRAGKTYEPFPPISPKTSRLTEPLPAQKNRSCSEWWKSASSAVKRAKEKLSCRCCECTGPKKDS